MCGVFFFVSKCAIKVSSNEGDLELMSLSSALSRLFSSFSLTHALCG